MNIEIAESSKLNVLKEDTKNLNFEDSLDEIKKEIGNIIVNTVDKAANYVIKAMPIPDALKDILKDVKKALKTKDFKEIIRTVINSSIREGLEFVGLSKSSVTSVMNLKDIMVKGGLVQGIKNCVDIFARNYLKNNIVGEYIYDFFDKLKQNILSKSFKNTITKSISKNEEKVKTFINNCNKWYEAYNNEDYLKLNETAEILKKDVSAVKWNKECINENKVIQNMTEVVNNKKNKLSDYQLQLCRTM